MQTNSSRITGPYSPIVNSMATSHTRCADTAKCPQAAACMRTSKDLAMRGPHYQGGENRCTCHLGGRMPPEQEAAIESANDTLGAAGLPFYAEMVTALRGALAALQACGRMADLDEAAKERLRVAHYEAALVLSDHDGRSPAVYLQQFGRPERSNSHQPPRTHLLVSRETIETALKTIRGLEPGRFAVEVELGAALNDPPCAMSPQAGTLVSDIGLLEDAADALTSFPAVFTIDARVPSAEELLESVKLDIAQLRSMIEEPVVLDYSDKLYLEVSPPSYGDRINVCHRGLGWASVNYSDEGLILDVFSNGEEPEPLQSLAFERADLDVLEE